MVAQDVLDAGSEGTWMAVKGSKMGYPVVMDFYTQMAIEGRAFQVRAGALTTPLTGDIDITTVAAEMCADALLGHTIIPIYLNVSLESFAGGTLPECAAKSYPAVSTAGAAFVPVPLFVNGAAAATSARVAAAGGVTVSAESLTLTRYHYTNVVTAQADRVLADIAFRLPPVCFGPACFYVQVAAATAGPVYFAHFDYIELLSTAIS
jgi:hypothetical protein